MRILAVLSLTIGLYTAGQAVTLNIAVPAFDPPFEMQADEDQRFSGFDIDIMMEICQRLNYECHFIPAPFAVNFDKLSAGKVDLLMGAISITPERQKKYLFSLPYLSSYGQFLSKNDRAVNTIMDIRGRRVGVLAGSVYESLVLGLFNNDVTVVRYPNPSDIVDALMNDKVDAVLMDEAASKYWHTSNPAFKLVGEHLKVGVGFGIVAQKNRHALIQQINHILIDMESDGTYLKIYKRYFD